MKTTMVAALFFMIFTGPCSVAQIQPYITYDPISGDYIVGYQGSQGLIEVYFVPATKINPVVSATVGLVAGTFQYQYRIANQSDSDQRLLMVLISTNSPVFQVTKPSTEWHSEPAGFLNGWEWGHTLLNADGGPSSEMGIAPGSIVQGFSFKSFGLPSIVNSYYQGLTGTMTFPEEPPEGVTELLKPLETFPANEVLRRTLAPRTPPARFIPLDFLDTLIAMKDEAKRLGWISPGSISTFIDVHFEKARNHLSEDDRSAAVEYMQDLRDEVSSAGCRHYPDPGGDLTTEACALLLFNIDYWLGQMRGG